MTGLIMAGVLVALIVGAGCAIILSTTSRQSRSWQPLELMTAVVLGGAGAAAIIAMLLGYLGIFNLWAQALSLLLIIIAGSYFARHKLIHLRLASPRWIEALAVIAAAATLTFGIAFHFDEIEGQRDPGVYVGSGIELARTGDFGWNDPLVVDFGFDAVSHLFIDWKDVHKGKPRWERLPGFYFSDPASGRILPQFLKGYEAWLAMAFACGGARATQCVNAAFAALALMAFFCALRRIVSGPAAIFGMILLSLNAAQLWYARFTSNEMMVQAFVWGFVFMYSRSLSDDRETRCSSADALFGLFLLTVAALTKFAAWGFIPLAAFVAGLHKSQGRLRVNFVVLWLSMAAAAAATYFHARFFAYYYFFGSWSFTAGRLGITFFMIPFIYIGGTMACVSLGSMLCPAWNALADRLAAPRVRATVISIAAIIVFAIFLHQLRLYTATAAEHRDVWGENTNLVEFAFYYSTPVFFVAVAGIALMIFRVNSPGFAALLLMLLGSSVFLVWRNIDALHPWAARRWMIFLLPVFCAGAAYPAAWLWEMRRWWSRIISFVAAALLAALILLAAPQLNLSRNFHGAIASADTLAQHFRPDDLILTHPTGMIQQFSPYLNARHGVGFYTQQYNAESWRASMPVARASALMGRRALYVSDVPIPVDGSEPPPFFKQIMSVPIRYKYLPDGNHALPTTATAENMTFRIYQMDPERIPPGWWPEMATIPENIRQELPVELRMNAKADPFLTNFFKPVDLPDGRSIRWTDGSGRVRIGDLITFPIREGPVRISAELNSGRPELAAPLQVEWYLNPNIPSRAWHLGTTGVWAEWTRAGVDVDASMLRPDSIIELKTLRPSVGTVFPQGKLGVLVSSIRAD